MTTVWHFAARTLRDGTPHPQPGWVSPEIADPVLCKHGWHGSERLIDALKYAPGPYLCQRELVGTVISGPDKHVASQCQQLTPYMDVTDVLVRFARYSALLALRVDAPAALRAAGLHTQADTLAALPDDCDLIAAAEATGATRAATEAAWAATEATGAATGAARATAEAATEAAAQTAWVAAATEAAALAAAAERKAHLNDWLERALG